MAVAIVKDGKTVFAKGYGVRKLGEAVPVDENTLFGIGSNTKAFTTVALALLVDEKRLAWNDPVQESLPTQDLNTLVEAAECAGRLLELVTKSLKS